MKEKSLKLLAGFLIIGIIQYMSCLVIKFSEIVFPPPLLGMILLSILLYFKIIPMSLMKNSCQILLDNMVLFFVPITIGVVLYTEIISKNLLVLSLAIGFSTILTLVAAAFITDYFVEKKQRELKNEQSR